MKPLRWLKQIFNPPAKTRPIRARYDAARNDRENRNHWAAVDSLGPINANSTDVRTKLAQKARLERENDPHFYGMTKVHAYGFVGTGPRWQPAFDKQFADKGRLVARQFARWCRAIDFADKLRILVEACPVDGETFAQIINNPRVDHPVKLDIRLLEHEQICTPGYGYAVENRIDGIVTDTIGNVTSYHVLTEHPGDAVNFTTAYNAVDARFVLHWFRPNRPGQFRGVSEFASSIETGAQARRYAKATLGKQEMNANIAGVIESDVPADTGTPPELQTMEEVDIPRMGLMTMPGGWKAKPFGTAENTTGYKEYMGMNHAAVGRPVLMPRNLITGDSSDFNFASGRMDHLPYQMAVWIDRERIRTRILDKVFRMWLAEAINANLIPSGLPKPSEWDWDWHWDGFPVIDEMKAVSAQEKRLALGLTTLAEENAADGKDWRDVARQRAAEVEFYVELGLPDPYAQFAPPEPAGPDSPAPDDMDASDDTKLEFHRRPAYV